MPNINNNFYSSLQDLMNDSETSVNFVFRNGEAIVKVTSLRTGLHTTKPFKPSIHEEMESDILDFIRKEVNRIK